MKQLQKVKENHSSNRPKDLQEFLKSLQTWVKGIDEGIDKINETNSNPESTFQQRGAAYELEERSRTGLYSTVKQYLHLFLEDKPAKEAKKKYKSLIKSIFRAVESIGFKQDKSSSNGFSRKPYWLEIIKRDWGYSIQVYGENFSEGYYPANYDITDHNDLKTAIEAIKSNLQ